MTPNEALLGRPEVRSDPKALLAPLIGKRVAVTGAAGTIGNEIVRTLGAAPAALLAMDRNESAMAAKLWGCDSSVACIASNEGARTLAAWKPDVVFHAAAYKHVTLMEGHARAALLNNVIGTANACAGPWRTVLVSTDKAIAPRCVMGATKRMAEEVVLARGGVVVRLVNVIGSAGSVVDIWRKGGDAVPLVSGDVSRWWMTAGEAADAAIDGDGAFDGETRTPDHAIEIGMDELFRRFRTHERPNAYPVPMDLRPGERAHETLDDPTIIDGIRSFQPGRALAAARDVLASDATDAESVEAMVDGGWLCVPRDAEAAHDLEADAV